MASNLTTNQNAGQPPTSSAFGTTLPTTSASRSSGGISAFGSSTSPAPMTGQPGSASGSRSLFGTPNATTNARSTFGSDNATGGLFSSVSVNNERKATELETKPGDFAQLRLLKGPGIEVVVGPKTTISGQRETWCLPQSLISHYSPFLKAACIHDFKEKEENRIVLVDEDPNIFCLFVEWMYYDRYTLPFGDNNANVKAWILGDKLMSVPFKNFAMERIYNAHIRSFLSAPVVTDQFALVCDNTVQGAKLRQFYIAFVVTNFSNTDKVTGTTQDWDNIMIEHDDVRTALLTALRSDGHLNILCAKDAYMEKESASKSTS